MSRDDKFEHIYISMQKANQIIKKKHLIKIRPSKKFSAFSLLGEAASLNMKKTLLVLSSVLDCQNNIW